MTLLIKVLRKGSHRVRQVELKSNEELVLGRVEKQLHLDDDPRLSRKHFKIFYTGTEVVVTHLSKTNPTLIAEEGETEFQEISDTYQAKSKCRIIAGSHRFQLEILPVVPEDSFYDLSAAPVGLDPPSEPLPQNDPADGWDKDLEEQDWQSSASHLGELPLLEELDFPVTHNQEPNSIFDDEQGAAKDESTPDDQRMSRRQESETIKLPKIPTVKRQAEKRQPVQTTPPKNLIDFDDVDQNDNVSKPKPKPKPKPKSIPKPTKKSDDKLKFPIDEDFFD